MYHVFPCWQKNNNNKQITKEARHRNDFDDQKPETFILPSGELLRRRPTCLLIMFKGGNYSTVVTLTELL